MRPPEQALPAGDRVELLAQSLREITRQNERLFGELLAGERRFRGLARSVWNVQEAERRRLARELHDGIGQTLTALKQQLDVVEQSAARAAGDGRAGACATPPSWRAQALHETRELSRLLRPQILDDLGLEPALRWLARTFAERTGWRSRSTWRHSTGGSPPELETPRLPRRAGGAQQRRQARGRQPRARCWRAARRGDAGAWWWPTTAAASTPKRAGGRRLGAARHARPRRAVRRPHRRRLAARQGHPHRGPRALRRGERAEEARA